MDFAYTKGEQRKAIGPKTKQQEDAMKKKLLVNINVSCDMPRIPSYVRQFGIDAIAEYCESWAAEFNDFVRDHRSQDAVSLCIEREYEDVCSFCGSAWEADESGTPCCCDKAREEFTGNLVNKESVNAF